MMMTMKKQQQGSVSIPYEREGAWKGSDRGTDRTSRHSFNSLRTGRGMERHCSDYLLRRRLEQVSIPYEREGAWKEYYDPATAEMLISFQFPTNGKGHGKHHLGENDEIDDKFQFPTNGKGHGKTLSDC